MYYDKTGLASKRAILKLLLMNHLTGVTFNIKYKLVGIWYFKMFNNVMKSYQHNFNIILCIMIHPLWDRVSENESN